MKKWIDVPPVWLLGFLFVGAAMPRGEEVFYEQALMGICLIIAGLGFILISVVQMRRHKTTIIPHRDPAQLVSTGMFAQTRNPIYLGDAFILTGFLFYWQSHVPALILVPAFMWVITQRFIKPEEKRLLAAFGETFEMYCEATRRWL